jgi:DNA-binding MarR family transcriptional regulator
MIRDNLAYISNYICRESVKNLNKNLSGSELKRFSTNDYYYLTAIYYLGKPNFSQIANELGLTKPAITVLIQKLIKMGLIEKIQSDNDKRVYYVNLTDKGEKIVVGYDTLYSDLTSLIENYITDKEKYIYIDTLLSEIAQSLKEQREKE